MKRIAHTLLILLTCTGLLFTISGLTAKSAYACSCAVESSFSDKLERAEAVFSGKVIAIRPAMISSEWNAQQVTLDVQQGWSEGVHQRMSVETSGESAACGYTFEKGSSYIVYAYNNEGGALATSACSGNYKLSSPDGAAELIRLSTVASIPLLAGSNIWFNGYRLYAGILVSAVVVMWASLWISRYRRRHREMK